MVAFPTRGFSVLLPQRTMSIIGRYWHLFKHLTAVSAGRFYQFEHIVSYSSFKAHQSKESETLSSTTASSCSKRSRSCRYAQVDARPHSCYYRLTTTAAPSSSIDLFYSVRPRHPSRAYTRSFSSRL
jgi:hypothetical protein